MEKFTAKVNKFSKTPIVVHEFQGEGDDPKEAFRNMMQEQKRCDGLVISGHHTGAWGGKRGNSLNLDFLEEISCEKEFQDWFSGVNALWLQGCRTLGVGEITSENADSDMMNPEFHTQRVGDALDEDALTQRISDLNMEFSATLDQDNPLSSRYLRLFPQAKVFGWTKTAPGEGAHSEYSIPFHMAHISKLMKDEFPGDPLKPEFDSKTAGNYLDALSLALSNLNKKDKACEELLVKAWKAHGQVGGPAPFSFDNPDLQAYSKLSTDGNEFLLQMKALECALKNASDEKTALAALRSITKDEKSIQYGFNSIWAKLKENEVPYKAAILAELKNNPRISQFLTKKLESKQLGLLPKLEYFAFYKELYKKADSKLEQAFFDKAKGQLDLPQRFNDFDMEDYKLTILQALFKNGFMTPERAREVLKLKTASATHISGIAKGIGEFFDQETALPVARFPKEFPREEAKKLLLEIARSPLNQDHSLAKALYYLREVDGEEISPESKKLLLDAMDFPYVRMHSFEEIGNTASRYDMDIPTYVQIQKRFLDHPRVPPDSVAFGVDYIGNHYEEMPEAEEFFSRIFEQYYGEKEGRGGFRIRSPGHSFIRALLASGLKHPNWEIMMKTMLEPAQMNYQDSLEIINWIPRSNISEEKQLAAFRMMKKFCEKSELGPESRKNFFITLLGELDNFEITTPETEAFKAEVKNLTEVESEQ